MNNISAGLVIPKETITPKKRKPNYTKITGYASIGAAAASAVAGNQKKIKVHKQLALLSGLLAAAHIGIVEWYHSKFNKR